jgi:hypothetical protein
MPELERHLRDLGPELEYPPTPDLAPVVARALERRRRLRRRIVVALALVALAVGVAFAVPPARSAILDWLGLRGVSVERAATLPPNLGTRLDLGRRVDLDEARRSLPFPLLVPAVLGDPDAAYLRRGPTGEEVTLVYRRRGDRPLLLVGEVRGRDATNLFGKVITPDVRVSRTEVAGAPAVWLEGAHAFAYFGPNGEFVRATLRLARNTLLWQRGTLVLRLEGAPTEEQALQIARSLA